MPTGNTLNKIDHLLLLLVKGLLNILGSLPLQWTEAFCTRFGRLMFRLAKRHRRIAIDNLTKAFGTSMDSRQITLIAREVFVNLCRIIFEIAWSRKLDPIDYGRYFSHSGFEHYQKAVAKGKGVLMLCAHFGNWELLPIIAHMTDMPVRIVYRPLDAPFLEAFFKENRCRFDADTIPKKRGAMRRIIRSLKKGHPIAMLMDQNVDWYEGVFVDYFGHLACTNSGMATIAVKTKTPVVPVFMIREKNRRFHAAFGPELPLIQTGDKRKDVESNTELYNKVIEFYARRFPEQWFWVHNRWKTRSSHPWPRIAK